eukprot:12310839-Ditylum_brightwellii.AAC.1
MPNWRQHKAEQTPSICLGAGRTLMYDMTQKVNHAVSTNRPDLVILDEEKKTALIINVTCLIGINMVSAAAKKHQKYKDLKIAMKK